MTAEIVVPVLGESVVEATVGKWLKSVGESVAAGEPVVELETEKVNMQVAAEEPGVLSEIVHGEGDTVHPGDLLARLELGAPSPAPGAPPQEAQAVQPSPPREPAAPSAAAAPPSPVREVEKAHVSPVAQKLAAELKVDLSAVQGSGPGGRIMKEDVEAVARQREAAGAPPSPAPAPTPPAPTAPPTATAPAAAVRAVPSPVAGEREEIRQRMSRRRLTIARRLVEAQHTAAMLTTFNEIDMSAVMDLRRRQRESFKAAMGVDLGFMSFFVKAVVGALKAFPEINAELQGEELVLKHYYDIGIALGDPEGLVVPVLRDADRMSFAEIEKAIALFVQKSKERSLTLEELRGGTFTITNGGVFGSLMSTPILNPPQVGILGMHKISERPVAVNGQMAIRPMMYVALSYDHRVVDGREAVLFLVKVKELLEEPARMLLEG
ncbi:MAG TPA: 2-oxoglutarate dehydrogenase complex dihydrolipoyllysine-residue succinyltransferase [Chloroflexota bacterium]|nr:2-oxoglutarate dehydrogenase complex dihydrolipoyllysine-residue succinyltransferase [Chloroflexota bacterium]